MFEIIESFFSIIGDWLTNIMWIIIPCGLFILVGLLIYVVVSAIRDILNELKKENKDK
ncbi:MAG: hypothetical protein IJ809_00015 [Clostridia bacterium]|nr:hypothetical protein [Clostridia bacterium]